MALFSISSYDAEGNCKICGSPASEIHKEGCELGAVYVEIKKMRLVIEQFLKLLGVETITSAFAKIAAEHSMHPTLLDSASLEALSKPEHSATSQTDQTPPQRG